MAQISGAVRPLKGCHQDSGDHIVDLIIQDSNLWATKTTWPERERRNWMGMFWSNRTRIQASAAAVHLAVRSNMGRPV